MSESQHDLERALAILAVAASKPTISLAELARRIDARPGEVANDLFGTLSMCGTPPYLPHDYVACTLQHGQVTVRFADQFRRPISLNPIEALSLKLAIESLVPPDEATPRVVVDLLRKIEEGMSSAQRARFRALAKGVVARAPLARASIVRTLRDAIRGRTEVAVEHRAPGRSASARRTVRPLGLLSRGGAWYLVAIDGGRLPVRSFRLDRIAGARATEKRFEPPEDFKLEAFARSLPFSADEGAARAVVRFRGPSARWIREVAEAGEIDDDGDESVWRTPLVSERGFASFLLGLGAEFVVEEPVSLRGVVEEMLSAVTRKHSGRGDQTP
jgi:predicted DNA-binding transcriptional regulator YafY